MVIEMAESTKRNENNESALDSLDEEKAINDALNQAETRQQKLQRIKQQVEDGTYFVKSESIIQKIMNKIYKRP